MTIFLFCFIASQCVRIINCNVPFFFFPEFLLFKLFRSASNFPIHAFILNHELFSFLSFVFHFFLFIFLYHVRSILHFICRVQFISAKIPLAFPLSQLRFRTLDSSLRLRVLFSGQFTVNITNHGLEGIAFRRVMALP